SLLSMSGFETLAQVYREIASPKLKNLKITANIVCFYAIISTGLITLFAAMIIPDNLRRTYVDNLIAGLAMNLAGPEWLRLLLHIFVVLVGVLILSGASNTSLIGANGVLNRVAEDGVLFDFFRKPHKKFGTTYHILNLITGLQLLTILLSRGDVYLLGEAYAFGVVWSFTMKALGVLALRFQRHDQEYKFPVNLHIAGKEIPIGLAATTLVLLTTAIVNLFSKQNATIYGVGFTIAFFLLFTVSERINAVRKPKALHEHALEEFNLQQQPKIDPGSIHARPGSILIAVRNRNNLHHLRRTLHRADAKRNDIVVVTVRPVGNDSEYELNDDQFFGAPEKELFTDVVNIAEKEGTGVELLVVPGADPFEALVQVANQLQVSRLVTGVSPGMSSDELARRIGLAWEHVPEPRHPFALEVITPERPSTFVNVGPHPPRLWPEDIEQLHKLWLQLSGDERLGCELHHRDVVGFALRRLQKELASEEREEILRELERQIREHS
ncbi:MAG: amino acid permease, partial [Acidobacteriaceae bacterium]|nr:amino acid permease [Acidobacteriaceae bacterium]